MPSLALACLTRVYRAGSYVYLWAWEPLHPRDLAPLLSGFDRRWWICGGWALDLFLDRETRRHDDLDVAVLRRDQLAPPIHAVWARRSHEPVAPWTCEFWLDEDRDGRWCYGPDERVTRPLDELGMERNGVPFLAPELALLHKSRERSPKNEADFAAVAPQLSESAALWLHQALETCDPGHPWLARLPHARG